MKRLTATICLTIAVLLGRVEVGMGYVLPLCPGSPLEITRASDYSEWDNCQGQYSAASSLPKHGGDKFVGEFRDGQKHGQGTYVFGPSSKGAGNKYVGEWRDNKRHGQGIYTTADGDKYVGEWWDGYEHGQGTYNWAKGDKYVGEFRDNYKHGQGIQYYADGTVGKEGIWKDNEFQYAKKVTP